MRIPFAAVSLLGDAAASSSPEPAAAARLMQRKIKDDVEKLMQAQPERAESPT